MPFRGRNVEEILSENTKGQVNFNIPELSKASNEGSFIIK